jgi:ubiquinone/menaquinone biosynthesis C-methylase UbiE
VEKVTFFWEELCGTSAFRALGLNEINAGNLKKFDEWYLYDTYPYLLQKYIMLNELHDKDVLEIGLGFGTVGEKLFLNSKSYVGLDYAKNPVELMNYRIKEKACDNKAKSIRGDAKKLPFNDNNFDYIVSIGCLHHTGDVQNCVNEIYRVLRQNGTCLIMLYNKNSYRRIINNPFRYIKMQMKKQVKYENYEEFERASYDQNLDGEAAPITEYFSVREVKIIFKSFRCVTIHKDNFDDNKYLSRKLALKFLAKSIGLDLYIKAVK